MKTLAINISATNDHRKMILLPLDSLNQETSRVNKAINKELEKSTNLTLGNYFNFI